MTVDIESELFRRATQEGANRLLHPTARAYSASLWRDALNSLPSPSVRDRDLATAAIWFGGQMESLRATFETRLFEGLSRRQAIILSIAQTNREFRVLVRKAARAVRKSGSRDAFHVNHASESVVRGATAGNRHTIDDLGDALVDTLPHLLDRAVDRPLIGTSRGDVFQKGVTAVQVLSIEHSIRTLWQQALWEGWRLGRKDDAIHFAPVNQNLEVMWNAWHWRHRAFMNSRAIMQLAGRQSDLQAGIKPQRFLQSTVVKIERRPGQRRRFVIGPPLPTSPNQSHYWTEHTILESSYVGMFLDAPLPKVGDGSLSCRILQRAWCVLRDIAHLLEAELPKPRILDLAAAEEYALLVKRGEIANALEVCCQLSSAQSSAILDFFTCSASDRRSLFSKGVWSMPLVSLADEDRLAIVLSPLHTGAPIRKIELWLERGGLSDQLAGANRGSRYEAMLRERIDKKLKANPIFQGLRAASSLPRRTESSEQIDLLIVFGTTLIVAEVKCLLAPAESIERYRYLRKLKGASEQAVRKAKWIGANRAQLIDAIRMTEDEISRLRIIPLVVVNQGFGVGWRGADCLIIDAHFLGLYLADGSYLAQAAVQGKTGESATAARILYSTQSEAEFQLESIISDPPVLRRFVDVFAWRHFTFPTATGDEMCVAAGHFAQSTFETEEAERLAGLLST